MVMAAGRFGVTGLDFACTVGSRTYAVVAARAAAGAATTTPTT